MFLNHFTWEYKSHVSHATRPKMSGKKNHYVAPHTSKMLRTIGPKTAASGAGIEGRENKFAKN